MAASRTALMRVLPYGLLVAGVIWAYFPVLAEMARDWTGKVEYSHAYLVPLFSLYLLWHFRASGSTDPVRPAWITGLALVFLGIGLRFAGVLTYFIWFESISLLPLLAGSVLLLGGWPTFRQSWAAIGFLVFMIPLPHRVETMLSQPLQNLATYLSTYVLQTAGWPAFREGNVITINDHHIGIVAACNGLGMLLLFFAFATAAALLVKRHWFDRVVILLSAIPIALISNVIRIVATSMLYDVAGQKWGDLLFHDLAGWVMMPIALGLLWLELRLLDWILIPVPEDSLNDLDFSGTRFGQARG